MSALLKSGNVYRSLSSVTEPEATLTISRLALRATDPAMGLASLAGVALRVPGVQGIKISFAAETFEWRNTRSSLPYAYEWGCVRVLFEPHLESVESPESFTRFLGQQIGLMLDRLKSIANGASLTNALARLQQRLETRKAVHRAAGLLARERSMTHNHGVSLLIAQARQTRRPLWLLAQAIILKEIPPNARRLSRRPVRYSRALPVR